MTKREREQLREGVRLLMGDGDGDWESGMEIVCRLAGLRTAVQRLANDLRPMDIAELASLPDGEFKVFQEEAEHAE